MEHFPFQKMKMTPAKSRGIVGIGQLQAEGDFLFKNYNYLLFQNLWLKTYRSEFKGLLVSSLISRIHK